MRRKVLYFGAHAPGTVILGLGDEVGAIAEELRNARNRCLDVEACWVSEADDLVRELSASTPAIVHLSGPVCEASGRHAAGTAHRAEQDRAQGEPGAGDPDGAGLVLLGPEGSVQLISYAVMKQIFARAAASVRLVVLTACNTEPLASLLREHVECVIGIDGLISDRAALEFSRGLYAAICDGASVAQGFDAGCLAIQCAGLPEAERPTLKVRPGVDARHVGLAVIPRRRPPRDRCTPGPVARRPSKHPAPRRGRTRRRGKLDGLRSTRSAIVR
jgi:hypothetical protein